jgi:hypothetical protein
MSEHMESEPEVVLAQAVQRRWWRIPRSLGWVALVAVLGLKFAVCQTVALDCANAAGLTNDSIAVMVCQQEYVHTGDPQAGVLLASAEFRTGNHAVASAIADGLLVTAERGGALRVLGQIATAEQHFALAERYLLRAQTIHRAEHRLHELARDDQALIGTRGYLRHYTDALRSADDCARDARAADDPVTELYCHSAPLSALLDSGAFETAERELREVDRLTHLLPHNDRNLAWLAFESANVLQEAPHDPLQYHSRAPELAAFRAALPIAERAQLRDLVVGTELNIAHSQIEDGQLAEAAHYIDEADIHDHADDHLSDRMRLRADLALHQGDVRTTTALCDRLWGMPEADDTLDRIETTRIAARAALAASDLETAERWARRGITEVSKLSALQRTAELRALSLSRIHEPYELLFAVLVRAGKLDDAVQAFDQLQGHLMLDALLRPSASGPLDLRQTAAHFDRVEGSAAELAKSPMLNPGPGDVQIAKIRATELVALVIAEGDLWRITTGDGQLAITDLGSLVDRDELRREPAADCSEDSTKQNLHLLIEHFAARPTQRACADKLGQLLLPDAVFHASDTALRVVLDAPLTALPVAALRHAGEPIIALRPIVRAPRLSAVECAHRAAHRGRPVIVADANANLPFARDEAQALSRALGVPAQLGDQATSAAVRVAAAGGLLYVGTHAGVDEHGGYLQLADGLLYALDLSQRAGAPERVVLASCVSALSNALGSAGSLATAFLVAGSTQVVATLRRVSDPGAHELTTAFFANDGTNDPARALARAQRQLFTTSNTDWPSFAVFGQEFCTTTL